MGEGEEVEGCGAEMVEEDEEDVVVGCSAMEGRRDGGGV